MHHAYVIFDNDAPLSVVAEGGEKRADIALKFYKDQLRADLRQHVAGNKREEQYTQQDMARLEELIQPHYIHYHLVPVFSN